MAVRNVVDDAGAYFYFFLTLLLLCIMIYWCCSNLKVFFMPLIFLKYQLHLKNKKTKNFYVLYMRGKE